MQVDTAIIGAGAAGMMCAAHAGGRVLLIDHAKAPGEKIRISGGGRCNFTNLNCAPHAFLSQNPHFAKSALAKYTQWDFIDLVDCHGIAWHEKTLGQLFCDVTAKDIVAMLRGLMDAASVQLHLQTRIEGFAQSDAGYTFTAESETGQQTVSARNVVIATGGKSIPKMGATGFAYDVAAQFEIPIIPTRAGLVPFTFAEGRFAPLSGVATPSQVSAGGGTFEEALLFTHRGLSGPAVLQASSYWQDGTAIDVNLDPQQTILAALKDRRQTGGKRNLTNELARHLPARLVEYLATQMDLSGNLADQSDVKLTHLIDTLSHWQMTPAGTEGYRTAEVTVGGIDTDALSSKTMMSKSTPGLYFRLCL